MGNASGFRGSPAYFVNLAVIMVIFMCIPAANADETDSPSYQMHTFYSIGDSAAFPSFPLLVYRISGTNTIYWATWQIQNSASGAMVLAVDDSEERIFISFKNGSDLAVINARTGIHESVISVSGSSNFAGLTVHQSRGHLFVVERGATEVLVYDTNTLNIVGQWTLPSGNGAHSVDLLDDQLYVADATNVVRYYDIDTHVELGSVTLSQAAGVIAVTDTPEPTIVSTAFDGDSTSSSYLSRHYINTATEDTVYLGIVPKGLALNPPDEVAFVMVDDQFRAVDLSSMSILYTRYLPFGWVSTGAAASGLDLLGDDDDTTDDDDDDTMDDDDDDTIDDDDDDTMDDDDDDDLTFLPVPEGGFDMGSPDDEPGRGGDEDIHRVDLTRAFEISQSEVSHGVFVSYMGYIPAQMGSCNDGCPVVNVSWFDAAAMSNVLSDDMGLTACYDFADILCENGQPGTTADYCAGQGGIDSASITVTAASVYDCEGYRLPTESEWEYAARAGTQDAFFNGPLTEPGCSPVDPNLDQIGWYCGNSGNTPHFVMGKSTNLFGLFDTAGNAFEWVWDWYDTYGGDATDPEGPSQGLEKVFRGGGWNSNSEGCRSAKRAKNDPGVRFSNLGFRLARTLPAGDDDDDDDTGLDDDDDDTGLDDDDDDTGLDDDDDDNDTDCIVCGSDQECVDSLGESWDCIEGCCVENPDFTSHVGDDDDDDGGCCSC